MIKINNKSIKTSVKEITLFEYEKISNKLAETTNNFIDKYIGVLEILGMSDEDINTLGSADFYDFVKEFNKEVPYKKEKVKSFILNGVNYVASVKDGSIFLNIKDLSALSDIITSNTNIYPGIIAVIFKDTTVNHDTHYKKEHIHEKINLFKDLKTSEFLAVIVFVLDKMNKSINK